MEWSNKCQKAGSDKVYTFIRWEQRAPLAEGLAKATEGLAKAAEPNREIQQK